MTFEERKPDWQVDGPVEPLELTDEDWAIQHDHERHVVERVQARMRICDDHEAALLVGALWAYYAEREGMEP